MSRLFELGEDSFHHLLSWLDLVCLCKLDIAIGNEDEIIVAAQLAHDG